MAYEITVGTMVEIAYVGTLFNQKCMNVFHYVQSSVGSTTDGPTILEALIAAIDGATGAGFALTALMSEEVQGIKVRAQYIYPERWRAIEEPSATPTGQQEDPAATANVAASVTLLADQATRHGIGRKSVYGVPQTAYSSGQLVSGYYNDLTTFGEQCENDITTAVVGTWVPVIFNRVAPHMSLPITSSAAQRSVRGQRSRVLGNGI